VTAAEVYEGMPLADYLALPAESATGLRDMDVSPLLYRWRRDQPIDADALRVGRAAHTAILEPQRFRYDYAVWDGGPRRGNDWAAFQLENQGRTIVTQAQCTLALEIAKAVRQHPIAADLLSEGRPELSMMWRHERTGLLCKARMDWLRGLALVEVKTCRDPEPRRFANQFARLGYHIQGAHYNAGIIAAGWETRPIKVIAAQNCPPFDVVVYDVPLDALLVGEDAAERALDRVAECRRARTWPGHALDAEVTLHLPAWVLPQDDEITVDGEALFGGGV
jgi:hypothetical protein